MLALSRQIDALAEDTGFLEAGDMPGLLGAWETSHRLLAELVAFGAANPDESELPMLRRQLAGTRERLKSGILEVLTEAPAVDHPPASATRDAPAAEEDASHAANTTGWLARAAVEAGLRRQRIRESLATASRSGRGTDLQTPGEVWAWAWKPIMQRLRACRASGLPPAFTQWPGWAEEHAFIEVVAHHPRPSNLMREHLLPLIDRADTHAATPVLAAQLCRNLHQLPCDDAATLMTEWLALTEERRRACQNAYLLWGMLSEVMMLETAGMAVAPATGDAAPSSTCQQSPGWYPAIAARMEWLGREAQRNADARAVLANRAEVTLLRLGAFEHHVEQICPPSNEAPSTNTAERLEEWWHGLRWYAQLSAEAQEIAEACENQGDLETATRLAESLTRIDAAAQRLRSILAQFMHALPPERFDAWRQHMHERCDDVLSQVSARSLAWSCNALATMRAEVTWVRDEYRRRSDTTPSSQQSNGAGWRSMDRTLRDLNDEYYERRLQARLEGLLTPTGARALELTVLVLIVAILTLIGYQISLAGWGLLDRDIASASSEWSVREFAGADASDLRRSPYYTRAEILEPWMRWLEFVDFLICMVFLAEFALKMWLCESRSWYLRRRWLTDLLPSIPFGFLLQFSGGNLVAGLRSLRLFRVLAMSRVLRLITLLQRVADRLVRKFRQFLDINIVLFDEHPDDDERAPARARFTQLRHQSSRLINAILAQSRRLLQAQPAEARTFHAAQASMLASEARACSDAELLRGNEHARRRLREIRIESLIDQLKHLDTLQIEAALGAPSVAQMAGYLKFLAPLHRPVLGIQQSLRRLSPSDTLLVVAVAAANRLETFFEHVVNHLRDLYGIVSVPEFLSFVGGFFARVFRVQRNRLFVGLAVVVMSLAMIQLARNHDMFVLRVAMPNIDAKEAAWLSQVMEDEAIGLRGSAVLQWEALATPDAETDDTSPDPPALLDDRPGTLTLELFVPQYRYLFSTDRARLAAERLMRTHGQSEATIQSITEQRALLGQLGTALRNSFGVVLIVVGTIGLFFVWFGNWLMNRAGQVVDVHLRVAEAQFINLMKHHKRQYLHDDILYLTRRVLRPELSMHQLMNSEAEPQLHQALLCRVNDSYTPSASTSYFPHQHQIIDRLALLYLDYLDGAILHHSDKKTTEQLLGNLSIRQILLRLRLTRDERLALERLDLGRGRTLFGPYIWFAFITNSISQKVGRAVLDLNDRYQTTEFTALHLLSIDPIRDDLVQQRLGDQAIEDLRQTRRNIIRSVFGTYPLQPRTINPYMIYRNRYEGGIRIFRLPIDMAWLAAQGITWPIRRLWVLIDGFLHPQRAYVPPSPLAGLSVAHRKINRMRRPIFMATLKLRARFDLAYIGVSLPGCNLVGCEQEVVDDDLRMVGALPQEMAAIEQLRTNCEQLVGEGAAVIDELKSYPRHASDDRHRRYLLTRWVLEPELRRLRAAEELRRGGLMTIVRREAQMKRPYFQLCTWHFQRVIAAVHPQFSPQWKSLATQLAPWWQGPISPADAQYLQRAIYFDQGSLQTIALTCQKHRAFESPLTVLEQMLDVDDAGLSALADQLLAIRTVQSLARLDILNIRRLVGELGQFAHDR